MPATNTRKTHTSFEEEQHASIAGVRLQNDRPQLACSCSNYCSYAVNYLYSARFGLLRIKASHAEDECLTGILLWDHSAVWATVVLERKTAFLLSGG